MATDEEVHSTRTRTRQAGAAASAAARPRQPLARTPAWHRSLRARHRRGVRARRLRVHQPPEGPQVPPADALPVGIRMDSGELLGADERHAGHRRRAHLHRRARVGGRRRRARSRVARGEESIRDVAERRPDRGIALTII